MNTRFQAAELIWIRRIEAEKRGSSSAELLKRIEDYLLRNL